MKVYWKALSDNFWTIVILLLALVAVVAVPFVAWDIFSALRRDYVSTHTSYPVTEHHTRGEQLTRYERFEAVKGFLRGQVMKQTGGKANPALLQELIRKKLGA